ncbi:hypothetical protein PSACC_01362 [Paramicrosporidium saccamoebae]|uniref:Uncharacterized protein n=1 Tax=Paramicrosporidium saccamoebae TaxID=1246581 RepID=A0A2H9TM38_9FUNG|nr:hypothetical protein PSACC_01362 [Paramicrosporidium saccamoebae]
MKNIRKTALTADSDTEIVDLDAETVNSVADMNYSKIEELAKKVKPVRVSSKKGKKFADKSFMMSLVDSVNKVQEEKIQSTLERESEILKRLTQRENNKSKKRETKSDKVKRMKDRLQKGGKGKGKGQDKEKGRGQDKGKGKGDHRNFDGPKGASKDATRPGAKGGSGVGKGKFGDKPRKKVSFK